MVLSTNSTAVGFRGHYVPCAIHCFVKRVKMAHRQHAMGGYRMKSESDLG